MKEGKFEEIRSSSRERYICSTADIPELSAMWNK
jgi:hypothetical protein